MIINECYLCKDNTYIIINYNNNKVIEHEKVDKLYGIVQDQHVTVDALYEDIKKEN